MVALTAVTAVAALALGAWFGSIVFFSFFGAPTIFATLDEGAAGRAVNAIFPRYYRFGLGAGAVALVAGGATGVADGVGPAVGLTLGGALVGTAANAYAAGVLVPKMEAAGDDAFARYHKQSVALNLVTMLAVLVAFVGTQL
ncbi:MAG: DUF4149 domain-containing protein [Halobacteriaceae archaeon]